MATSLAGIPVFLVGGNVDLNEIRWRYKDLLERPLAARAYGLTMSSLAFLSQARHDEFTAISRFLRGWRIEGSHEIQGSCTRRASRYLRALCYRGGEVVPLRDNPIYNALATSPRARNIRRGLAQYPADHRVRMRMPVDEDPERQGDLIILKEADTESGELGVVLVTYTESIEAFAVAFDLPRLVEQYMVVLEPSSWGYQDPVLMSYLGQSARVLIEAPCRTDFTFIKDLRSNLTASRIGAGDWIDPESFQPSDRREREYDIAMVSSWHPIKRHADVFRAVASIRARFNRTLRLALIGYPSVWSQDDLTQLAARYGVLNQCTIFESVPQQTVADVLSRSKVYVLASHREGANRAMYEALFCDTPVVVYRNHRGVNTDHVTSDTGCLFEQGGLDEAILSVLDNPRTFRPREWALSHTGYQVATRVLNEHLSAMAQEHGLPWTRQIVEKKLAPGLRYSRAKVFERFDAEYGKLRHFLREA